MRREPTLGGLKHDHENENGDSKNRARPAKATAKRPSAAAAAPAPVRTSSGFPFMASFAFLVALTACGAAYWLYGELQSSQAQLQQTQQRLLAVEESLKLTGSESTQSVAAINDSLKTHFSEIDKLWAAYRKHKKSIADNSKLVKTANANAKQALAKAKPMAAELAMVSDLVDAQQSALTQIEQANASIATQARAINEKSAKLQQSVSSLQQQVGNVEKDIEAINGFRRSVNQQILEIKGG
ncbi:hypothetical protein [Agaribacterium haliotis]|uniref:hypothetical protein n=1 Tax=Agaribacterium haliotis TaxID=2013869 RepID=UPI000BB56E4E|nr:hypothetical protein [Agaribacterium haliotis]